MSQFSMPYPRDLLLQAPWPLTAGAF